MVQSELAVCVFGLIACFCLRTSDATLCRPNSKFKYDCNTCSCSSTGREFSCTNTICAPIVYKDKYLIEQNEKGYNILIPKLKGLQDEKKSIDDNGLFLNDRPSGGKVRRSFIKMASYRKKPSGNFVEQTDYADYDDSVPPIPDDDEDDEDSDSDYDFKSNEDSYDDSNVDDYPDEDLNTFGKLARNRL